MQTPPCAHIFSTSEEETFVHGYEQRKEKTGRVKWEVVYLFTELQGKPVSLVCLETLSIMKDFYVHRNTTLHKAT